MIYNKPFQEDGGVLCFKLMKNKFYYFFLCVFFFGFVALVSSF